MSNTREKGQLEHDALPAAEAKNGNVTNFLQYKMVEIMRGKIPLTPNLLKFINEEFDREIEEMANDPWIQRKNKIINQAFEQTNMDGLKDL